MSLFFESLKPVTGECTIKKWREHALEMRKLLDGKDRECRDLRNHSRRLRYETEISNSWDSYFNNIKLKDRENDTEALILYAENILPQIAKEKRLIQEEKYQTEALLQKCDTWIAVCIEGLNSLDRKAAKEMARDDESVEETKQEIKMLEDAKANMKATCIEAWETSNRLENIEMRLGLNLEFKRDVLATDVKCQAIDKMDSEVSYKVDATKGPKKMLTNDEWFKTVYNLVDKAQNEIVESMKQREKMVAARGVSINEYTIQLDKTDYAMRKRIYEINKEKNENQYQLMKVDDLMAVTKAEWNRLELFLIQVKDDLRCAETRCSERFFRPSPDATIDPPFVGMNKEVYDLQTKVGEIEDHLDTLKIFYNKLESDRHKLFLENQAKNKGLQIQIQALDIRIAGRYDPMKIYAYDPNVCMCKMVSQLPPPFNLYSNKI